MAKQPRERNLSDASTTRRQRIARFIGQYVELNVRCILDRPSLEMVVAFMTLRTILRAQYPQDNANRTEPTYPWNINEGETT